MKRGNLIGVVAVVMVMTSGVLDACGDKFLGAGRGPRFSKVYAAMYPGRIVLYAPAKGELASIGGLDKALRRAGHQVVIAKDLPELTRVLQDRAIDIVIADTTHTTEADSVAADIATKPSVLLVSKSTVNFLRTLDDAMKSRLSIRPFSPRNGK